MGLSNQSIANPEPSALEADEFNQVSADLRLRLEAIREPYLRDASVSMLDGVVEYKSSKKGHKKTDAAAAVDAAVEMCLRGRRVFCYYERFEVRGSEKAALEIRDDMRLLFSLASTELSWIPKHPFGDETLTGVYSSISKKLQILETNERLSTSIS